jgi:hypothetical protein
MDRQALWYGKAGAGVFKVAITGGNSFDVRLPPSHSCALYQKQKYLTLSYSTTQESHQWLNLHLIIRPLLSRALRRRLILMGPAYRMSELCALLHKSYTLLAKSLSVIQAPDLYILYSCR